MSEISSSEIYRELSQTTFTYGMKESDIRKLAQCAMIGTYPMGQVLFSEADHHNRVHLLCEGLVALEMRVPKHGVQRILTLGPNEILAWSGFLADGAMTTSAIAIESIRTIEFDCHQLKRLCEDDHDLGYFIMKQVAVGLARRLLATRLQLLDLFRV